LAAVRESHLQPPEIVVLINRDPWQVLIPVRALLNLAVHKLENSTVAINRKAVMVIAGHDLEANTALFDWLRSIGLQPLEWGQLVHSNGNASPYNGEILALAFQAVQAVIAFFTPDEYVFGKDDQHGDAGWRLQARPNVLVEAGMAMVAQPERTVLAVLGPQELPSDLAGRYYIRLTRASPKPLLALAHRLQDAGCDVDLTGADWLNSERFPDREHIPNPPAIPRIQSEVTRLSPPDAPPSDAALATSQLRYGPAEGAGDKGALYTAFWQRFLQQLNIEHPEWSRPRKVPAGNRLSVASSFKGECRYNVSFPSGQRLRCELYIDWPDPAEVQEQYQELYRHREAIEAVFGGELSWEAAETRRASHIAIWGKGAIEQTERYEEFIDWFLTNLQRLRTALDPYA
jgi:predicted nucleotide-binding protein